MNAINIAALIISISSSLVALASIEFIKVITTIVLCVVSFAIPILYRLLVKSVRVTQKAAKCQTVARRHKQNNIRMAKNVQLLIGCTFMSYIPTFSVAVVSMVKRNSVEMYYVSRMTLLAVSLNSCFNPILYILKNKTHQRVLRRFFRWRSSKIGIAESTIQHRGKTNGGESTEESNSRIASDGVNINRLRSTIRINGRINSIKQSETLESISEVSSRDEI